MALGHFHLQLLVIEANQAEERVLGGKGSIGGWGTGGGGRGEGEGSREGGRGWGEAGGAKQRQPCLSVLEEAAARLSHCSCFSEKRHTFDRIEENLHEVGLLFLFCNFTRFTKDCCSGMARDKARWEL